MRRAFEERVIFFKFPGPIHHRPDRSSAQTALLSRALVLPGIVV